VQLSAKPGVGLYSAGKLLSRAAFIHNSDIDHATTENQRANTYFKGYVLIIAYGGRKKIIWTLHFTTLLLAPSFV
jgi:hypothetical protein